MEFYKLIKLVKNFDKKFFERTNFYDKRNIKVCIKDKEVYMKEQEVYVKNRKSLLLTKVHIREP